MRSIIDAMNVYRMIEDGQTVCVGAESMQAAVELREQAFVEEARAQGYQLDDPAKHYRDQILTSCELVGELANAPRADCWPRR